MRFHLNAHFTHLVCRRSYQLYLPLIHREARGFICIHLFSLLSDTKEWSHFNKIYIPRTWTPSSRSDDNSDKPTFSSQRILNRSANFLSVTCTRHENIAISATRDRRGRPLQSPVDRGHHSARQPEARFNPRAENIKRKSVQMPLTLPSDIKIGIVEIENDVGRMRHHLWEIQKKPRSP